MKRFTRYSDVYGSYIIDGNKSKVYSHQNVYGGDAVDRLAELEDKIEQGTLVELPCKVGDKIYLVEQLINSGKWVLCNDYASEDYVITDIYLNINKEPKFRVKKLYGTLKLSDFGKTVFPTREEAEKRLKEMQE